MSEKPAMQGVKDLTTGTIKRRLFNLALPIMGTSFIHMAYGITDMAWVGRLGSEAVAAVGAVGILMWMAYSIAYLTKIGAEVSVAQSIGAQNEKNARLYASHNLTIALIISLILATLMLWLAHPVISFFQLEQDISEHAVNYMRIVVAAFPCFFLSVTFTGIYNAAGLSKIPFYISGSGLVLNMILDPLFIFGFGWGTDGAAWATALSEATVCFVFIYYIKRKIPLFTSFRFFVPLHSSYSKQIFRLGFPVAALNTLFAVINLIMGRAASTYGGHIGLTTMTAGGQIEELAWNTSQGFSTALSTFVAQNFAANRKDRVLKSVYFTMEITTVIGFFCTILFVFFGEEVFSLIVPEQAAYEAGSLFLRIDGYSVMFMMLEITMQGFFYGIGKTTPPAIISITFNALRIPMAIGLTALGMGISGVWWAISISSILKGIASYIWFLAIKKKILQ